MEVYTIATKFGTTILLIILNGIKPKSENLLMCVTGRFSQIGSQLHIKTHWWHKNPTYSAYNIVAWYCVFLFSVHCILIHIIATVIPSIHIQ